MRKLLLTTILFSQPSFAAQTLTRTQLKDFFADKTYVLKSGDTYICNNEIQTNIFEDENENLRLWLSVNQDFRMIDKGEQIVSQFAPMLLGWIKIKSKSTSDLTAKTASVHTKYSITKNVVSVLQKGELTWTVDLRSGDATLKGSINYREERPHTTTTYNCAYSPKR